MGEAVRYSGNSGVQAAFSVISKQREHDKEALLTTLHRVKPRISLARILPVRRAESCVSGEWNKIQVNGNDAVMVFVDVCKNLRDTGNA